MSGNKGLSSRAIIGSFYKRLEAVEGASWVNSVSMMFTSDQESETYKWLGQSPAMREWIGGRHATGLRENGITIENKKYEATMEIPVDWMRRDKTGQIMIRVNEMADRAVTHWASLLTTLIEAGESSVCYDGQFFFDTDHAEGDSGTQSNDIETDISIHEASGGSTTAPTPKQVQAMIMDGVQQMLGFKDDKGEPMNETARAFHVQVPTSYFRPAAAALGNPLLSGGESNTLVQLDGFTFSLGVNPRLSWTDKLAVYRADSNVAAFIRQEEEGVTVSAVAEGSELEFNEDKHHYGIKSLRNVGYGYWQNAVLVTAV